VEGIYEATAYTSHAIRSRVVQLGARISKLVSLRIYLIICSLFNGTVTNSHFIALNGWMIVNNELESMWKKVVAG
jgi:hypothetical protein